MKSCRLRLLNNLFELRKSNWDWSLILWTQRPESNIFISPNFVQLLWKLLNPYCATIMQQCPVHPLLQHSWIGYMVYSWPAHSWAKWQKPTRNILKICEIDWSNLCLQHLDTLTGNKNAGNYFWKVREITFNNCMDQILSNFAHLTPSSEQLWPFYILECSLYMNGPSKFHA